MVACYPNMLTLTQNVTEVFTEGIMCVYSAGEKKGSPRCHDPVPHEQQNPRGVP